MEETSQGRNYTGKKLAREETTHSWKETMHLEKKLHNEESTQGRNYSMKKLTMKKTTPAGRNYPPGSRQGLGGGGEGRRVSIPSCAPAESSVGRR